MNELIKLTLQADLMTELCVNINLYTSLLLRSDSLMYASMNGHTDAVRVLLNYGADPNIQNKAGKTALNVAKNPAIIALLKIQIRWFRRKSLLMVLSENGFLRSQQCTTSTVTAPLTILSVLSNEGLVRQIFSYI